MNPVNVVILAAGLGTRLGKPHPKPLTPLVDGRTILTQQLDNLAAVLGDDARIHIVVGFKMDLVMEAAPEALFVFNEAYDRTNTSQSLLKALRLCGDGPLLWLNGDVVFDPEALRSVVSAAGKSGSVVAVNTEDVDDEAVKYTLDAEGRIAELSKQVRAARGESVGINIVSAADRPALRTGLERCAADDYFERGIEYAIADAGVGFAPVDISAFDCVEVDFAADLERANQVGHPPEASGAGG